MANETIQEKIYVTDKVKYLTIVAVLGMSLVQLSAMNVAAGLAVIREAYAADGYGITAIQMIQTLPTLFVLVGSFLTAWMSKHFSTKTIMLLGLVLLVVFGTLPALILPYGIMLTTCAIKGLALGIITTLGAGGIFTRMFSEAPNSKAKYMSWQAIAKYLGGMAMPIVAGYLAAIAWNNIFYVNLLGVLSIIIVLFTMPKDRLVFPQEYTDEAIAAKDAAAAEAKENAPSLKEKFRVPASVWLTAIICFIWMAVFNAMIPNLAMRIASVGGDTVAAGFASTAYTWSSLLIAVIFVFMNKWFRRALMAVGFCFCALAMVGLGWFTDTVTMCFVWTVCGGIGVGIVSVSSNIEVTLFAPGKSKLVAMAILTTAVNLGMFASPLILGPGAMALFGSDEPAYRYMVAAIVLVPWAILILIRQYMLMKQKKEYLLAKEHTDILF